MVSRMIHDWPQKDIGNIFKEKHILLARIDGNQKALEKGYNPFLLDLSGRLQDELEIILKQKEILWIRKSRQTCLKGEDQNTKFFHLSALVKCRQNKIERLLDCNGEPVSSKDGLKMVVLSYFQELFSNNNQAGIPLD